MLAEDSAAVERMAADPDVRAMAELCGMDIEPFIVEQLFASFQPAQGAAGALAPSKPTIRISHALIAEYSYRAFKRILD